MMQPENRKATSFSSQSRTPSPKTKRLGPGGHMVKRLLNYCDASISVMKFFLIFEFTTPPTPKAGYVGAGVSIEHSFRGHRGNSVKAGRRKRSTLTIILPILAKALTLQSRRILEHRWSKPKRPCLLYRSNPRRWIGVEISWMAAGARN